MVGVEGPEKLEKPGSVLPKLYIFRASVLVSVPVPAAVQNVSPSSWLVAPLPALPIPAVVTLPKLGIFESAT